MQKKDDLNYILLKTARWIVFVLLIPVQILFLPIIALSDYIIAPLNEKLCGFMWSLEYKARNIKIKEKRELENLQQKSSTTSNI